MIPFDLEKALAGAKVVTRGGQIVTELYHLKTIDKYYCLVGVVNGELRQWDKKGYFDASGCDIYDLFMARTERKEWIVRVGVPGAPIFTDKAAAVAEAETWIWRGSKVTIHEITIIE